MSQVAWQNVGEIKILLSAHLGLLNLTTTTEATPGAFGQIGEYDRPSELWQREPILTHTPDSSVIQVVAHWTLTSERSISVDTLTV